MSDKLRVMLVDDHEVVRQGLHALLDVEEDIEVVAEADSGKMAVELARVHNPEVVVMDVRMPKGSGVEACREIRDQNPDAQVIMLTSFSDDEALFNSIMAGAAGFVLKQIRGRDLIERSAQSATGSRCSIPESPSGYSRDCAKRSSTTRMRSWPDSRRRKNASST